MSMAFVEATRSICVPYLQTQREIWAMRHSSLRQILLGLFTRVAWKATRCTREFLWQNQSNFINYCAELDKVSGSVPESCQEANWEEGHRSRRRHFYWSLLPVLFLPGMLMQTERTKLVSHILACRHVCHFEITALHTYQKHIKSARLFSWWHMRVWLQSSRLWPSDGCWGGI